MGCAGEKAKLEDKIMLMKLERMEVQMEKEKQLKKLSELEGHEIKRNHIPDYIDPKFAREKQIYDDDDDENIGDKKTDESLRKNKKGKNNNKDNNIKKGKNVKKGKGKNDIKTKKGKKVDDKKKNKKK